MYKGSADYYKQVYLLLMPQVTLFCFAFQKKVWNLIDSPNLNKYTCKFEVNSDREITYLG